MIQVSVITCLYNTQPELFQKCLESIHNQTFKDFEVLILNDGSIKNLKENKKIIESFNDERFKYIDTPHTGKSQTLNYGFKIAKGKYIAISDSDDQMMPERLEYQYLFLENSDYEVISNAMITDDNHIIFPTTEQSHEVEEHNIGWSTMHPCMMLNKNKVLSKVPFLFSQIYDSMEDAIFNFIMYHSGVKMWYDSNIMQIYSHQNENSVHFENVTTNLKKNYTYKLINKTFNYKDDKEKYTTAILIVNELWGTDIEKTILNIRMTANNVNILVVDYSNNKLDLSHLNKYNVKIVQLDDNINKIYSNALIEAINQCDTQYCMIISKPFRFLTQEWDLIFERYMEQFEYKCYLIQPYMVGFDKEDENNYVNENGKLVKDVRCGQELNLFDKNISTKKDSIYLYSEYIFDANIQMLDDDLVFFTTTKYLQMFINGLSLFNISKFASHYLSIASTLMWGHLKIQTDIKGVVLNENIIDYNIKNYNVNYYQNLFRLICFFCNESKYIYEKILYDSFDDKSIPLYIVTDHIDNLDNFNKIKNSIKLQFDMSYFLKKNNTLRPWILTFKPY